MGIIISRKVREKLKDKHEVTEKEVHEAFNNRTGKLLFDTREKHPQTHRRCGS